MTSVVKCSPDKLQCGDQAVFNGKTWVIRYISEPDALGTYDLYLSDKEGNATSVIVTEPVTIMM